MFENVDRVHGPFLQSMIFKLQLVDSTYYILKTVKQLDFENMYVFGINEYLKNKVENHSKTENSINNPESKISKSNFSKTWKEKRDNMIQCCLFLQDLNDVKVVKTAVFRLPFQVYISKRPSYGQISSWCSIIRILLNLSGFLEMRSFLIIVVKLYSYKESDIGNK